MKVYKWWQLAAIAGPLTLVEIASFWKIASFLLWGYEQWLALTTGLAFVSLMLSAIVAMSLTLPPSMHRWIVRAGVVLLIVQGLANLLMVYQHEFDAMSTYVVTRFFLIDQESALRINAIVQGGTLSLVSLCFWKVLAQMLSEEWQAHKQRQASLAELDELLKQGAHG